MRLVTYLLCTCVHLERTVNEAKGTEVQSTISDTPAPSDNELSVKFATSTSSLYRQTSNLDNCT